MGVVDTLTEIDRLYGGIDCTYVESHVDPVLDLTVNTVRNSWILEYLELVF